MAATRGAAKRVFQPRRDHATSRGQSTPFLIWDAGNRPPSNINYGTQAVGCDRCKERRAGSEPRRGERRCGR
eukprot:5220734-Prymnesium_polylepis.2